MVLCPLHYFLSNVETTPWKISLGFFCFGVWTRVKKTTAPEFRSRWVRSFVESRLAGSGKRCKQGTTLNLLRERTGKGWVVCNRQNAAGTRRMIKNEAHGLCGRVLFFVLLRRTHFFFFGIQWRQCEFLFLRQENENVMVLSYFYCIRLGNLRWGHYFLFLVRLCPFLAKKWGNFCVLFCLCCCCVLCVVPW